jgi:hypothetical protein
MNGVYYLNSELFMSIWAFKTKHKIDNNTNKANAEDSKRIMKSAKYITIVPDFSHFKEVLAFKPEDIELFINIEKEELF